MVNFHSVIVRFKREDKKEVLPLFENVIEARMVFRSKDVEVAYVEFIDDNFVPSDKVTVINEQEAYDLACSEGHEDRVKIIDGVLYFKKYRRGGRVGRNGVMFQNKRKAYRVNPE